MLLTSLLPHLQCQMFSGQIVYPYPRAVVYFPEMSTMDYIALRHATHAPDVNEIHLGPWLCINKCF